MKLQTRGFALILIVILGSLAAVVLGQRRERVRPINPVIAQELAGLAALPCSQGRLYHALRLANDQFVTTVNRRLYCESECFVPQSESPRIVPDCAQCEQDWQQAVRQAVADVLADCAP